MCMGEAVWGVHRNGAEIDRSVAEAKKMQPSKQTPRKSFIHNIIRVRSVSQ